MAVCVAAVTPLGSAPVPVYCLTMDGPPEFFADGILAHNCADALRYAIMSQKRQEETAGKIFSRPAPRADWRAAIKAGFTGGTVPRG